VSPPAPPAITAGLQHAAGGLYQAGDDLRGSLRAVHAADPHRANPTLARVADLIAAALLGVTSAGGHIDTARAVLAGRPRELPQRRPLPEPPDTHPNTPEGGWW